MAKPKQNTERVSTFISKELLHELEEEALIKGTTVSGLIRMILHERRINKK